MEENHINPFEALSNGSQVQMPNGEWKSAEQVTEADILAFAKSDPYGISEKVTAEDLLLSRLSGRRYEMDIVRHEAAVKRLEETLAKGGLRRVERILLGLEVSLEKGRLENCRLMLDAISAVHSETMQLKSLQDESSDLRELYRKYLGLKDVSHQRV